MTVQPHLQSPTESEQDALDYIAANNADGRYNDVLARYQAGDISLGLLAFKGVGIASLRREQNRLYNLLQGSPAERLDIDVEAITKAHQQITETIAKAEDVVANPVVYALRKDVAA
ncbi:hypothetical protein PAPPERLAPAPP_00660 [Brevundimonas phage vB_BpoS-Papperlapapp]|uniref:Uncharacterized protein n=1 Tax=Brevundimonas phage vB_BpoS-Domovoi TaxID=2948598 RepID=A0A9E7SJY5_9CAUD|nr:hypothetical protein DOMOVOI_05430 [Brevundimonas phage vB_BpoS-Domovoi]USN15808.1 hypothetical protein PAPPERLAPAPP_00660 [Brevundimonas phage vB_BpoS-Papperlapapp]